MAAISLPFTTVVSHSTSSLACSEEIVELSIANHPNTRKNQPLTARCILHLHAFHCTGLENAALRDSRRNNCTLAERTSKSSYCIGSEALHPLSPGQNSRK